MYSETEAKDFILNQAYVILFNENSWNSFVYIKKGLHLVHV